MTLKQPTTQFSSKENSFSQSPGRAGAAKGQDGFARAMNGIGLSSRHDFAKNSEEENQSDQENLSEFLDRMNIDKDDFDLVSLQKEAEKKIDFFKTLNNMARRVQCYN